MVNQVQEHEVLLFYRIKEFEEQVCQVLQPHAVSERRGKQREQLHLLGLIIEQLCL